MNSIFDNLSGKSVELLMSSRKIAFSLGHSAQMPEHLIIAQFQIDTHTRDILRNELHFPEKAFSSYFLSNNPKRPSQVVGHVPCSDAFMICLDRAHDLRISRSQKKLLTPHIFLASATMNDISLALNELDFDLASTIRRFDEVMNADPWEQEELQLSREKKLVAIAKLASDRPSDWKNRLKSLIHEHGFTNEEIEAAMNSADCV